jgi:hypothetical protein
MVLIFGISIPQSPRNVYSGLCNLQKILKLSIVFDWRHNHETRIYNYIDLSIRSKILVITYGFSILLTNVDTCFMVMMAVENFKNRFLTTFD